MEASLYILDDDLYFGRCMKKQLEQTSAMIKYYKTERNFLKALSVPPDIVVLDYQLIGTNGLRIMDEMQRKGVWPEILLVSSQSNPKIVLKAYQKGALAYFEKSPQVFEQVRKTVTQLLNSSNNFEQTFLKESWRGIWKNIERKR